MEIATIGLLTIIAGWLIQLARNQNGNKELNKGFLALYATGCAILAIDGLSNNAILPALLNLACAIMPLILLAKIHSTDRQKVRQ